MPTRPFCRSAWLGFFSIFAGMAGAYSVGCIIDGLHRYRTCLFVFLSLAAVLFTVWSVIIGEKLEVCC